MDYHKVLIIKPGFSEILDKESNSRIVSLGDVLRTTVILNLFKKDHVTWVYDKDGKSLPLIESNPHINRILPLDELTIEQLKLERFDTVINLEKIPGICALVDRIDAWRKYGFRLDKINGTAEAYDKAHEILLISADPKLKKENKKTAQEILFEMIGAKWNCEEYILGYTPKEPAKKFDIALNTLVGHKWPTKAWPMDYWDKLENLLTANKITVTRQDKQKQEVLTNLYSYMDWINSSDLIITNDSLGLHLGIVLKKKIIGLFGPTPYTEVFFYKRGIAIYPEQKDCIPCFKNYCETGNNCMRQISFEQVYEKIKEYLKK